MVTATKRASSKSETSTAVAPPQTFAEVAAGKMAETITKYREFVTRHANGEALTGDELGTVVECLAYMRLPEYAWDRDVAAHREHVAASQAVKAMQATKHDDAARLTEITAKIKRLDEELKALRLEQYNLANVKDMQRVGHGQRLHELAANHPHLFLEINDAVRLRQDARNTTAHTKRQPMAGEPIPTWSIG